MALPFSLVFLTFFYILLLIPLSSSSFHLHNSCDNTPHPSLCKQTLSNNNQGNTIKDHALFCVNQSFYLAKDFKSLIKQRLRPPHTTSLSKSSIYALQDCYSLATLTLDYLSSTIQTISSATDGYLSFAHVYQAQTILSAIITNSETCFDGLIEAQPDSNVTRDLKPHIHNHTMLYSVSLALFTRGWSRQLFHGRQHYNEGRNGKRLLFQVGNMGINVSNMVVVNQNGSGNFSTVNDAVTAAPNNTKANTGYFGIYVMAGVYEEYVVIPSNKMYLFMVGDGINQTIITGNRSVAAGWTTFNSATFAVNAMGFVGVNITFQNTAGAIMHQAVAFRSGADLSAFYKCSFEGYQDTIYTHSMRQFYKECDIFGTVDFIFGNAAVVFQDCNIYARQPLKGQFNAITAQGRTDPNQNTATSIHNCTIAATYDLASSNYTVKTYLGRPWKEYSLTVYTQSHMGNVINPIGWREWSGNFSLDTLYYAEYNNTGPGSNTTSRVTWPGYHLIGADVASNFTVASLLVGDFWLPSTDVPFIRGLI